MLNLTTHTVNPSKNYLDINQFTVGQLVNIADDAIDHKGSWQSFSCRKKRVPSTCIKKLEDEPWLPTKVIMIVQSSEGNHSPA
ncbi:hypothetical protein JQC92_20960 [Shewanella sp. 202IG2-18]|uniref:hypothetical protein n=1 Tax=Parashewanella hymeniacidonis TaxID=2807618 RepID=UPI001961C9DF|nr:hypothetical protein [Parashewanella hymeniacidonis]MBM7074461.1 hypothetical protein [Parashewanella hymeniacidonis]